MKLFITGATGFLGSHLINHLSSQFEVLYVLTRKSDFSAFSHLPNVELVSGDITNLSVIENEVIRNKIITEVDFVIHAAALYDLEASHSDCYMQNVMGTQNTLRLIKKMKKLKAFYYISTIAVGDDKSFFLEEDHVIERSEFSDFYSETKFHAERLVRETFQKEKNLGALRIIRPGIIIGDSESGYMPKIDGPYYFIEAMSCYAKVLAATPFLPLSFNPRTKIPLIPVDHCARFISLIIGRDQFEPVVKTYHIISEEIPTVKEFLNDLNIHLGIKTIYFPVMRNPIHDVLLKLIGIPKALVPFMFSKLSYDKTRTNQELPELKMSVYSSYKNKLFGSL